MKDLTLNGKKYTIDTNINFGTMCGLEERGVDFLTLGNGKNTFTQIRNLVGYFTGLSDEETEKEITEHLKNGGSINDFTGLFEVLVNSDFFQKMAEKH